MLHAVSRRVLPLRGRLAALVAALALAPVVYVAAHPHSVGYLAANGAHELGDLPPAQALPASGLRSSFTTAGATVQLGSTRLSVGLRALGYGSALARVPGVSPRIQANRARYAHPGVVEWYLDRPTGLEQGFTVARPPSRDATGPLTLSLALTSNARASLTAGGRTITFSRAEGSALVYGGLAASDARANPLHSWMELHGSRLLLRVDARGAAYPVQIDPFVQQGEKLTGAGEVGEGLFGVSVALSADGNTAIVGGGGDNGGVGAAWVFTRSGSTWTQQGPKLTGAGEVGAGHFGRSVALSADRNTAVIGGYRDNANAGALWVFTRSGSTWTQQGPKLTGGEESGEGLLGFSLALSDDGNTALAAGGGDNGSVGAAWVFTRSGSTWTQQAPKLVGGEEVGAGHFGHDVALSGNGNVALIGGYLDKEGQGSAWFFTRSGTTWTQQGRSSGSSGFPNGRYGSHVALSGDGQTALIADQVFAGRVHVLVPSGSFWTVQALFRGPASTTVELGSALALSYDGNTALLGADGEHKKAGTAWVFQRSGKNWSIQPGGKISGSGAAGAAWFGESVALSGDANTALVGGPEDGGGVGAAWPFTWSPPPPLEPPEFGRCVNVSEPETGNYSNAQCTKTELQGRREWLPGASTKFATKITEDVATLKTVKGTQVVCTGETGSGEYTGTKTVGGAVLTLTGCELAGEKCSSPSASAGEVRTGSLAGVLGVTTAAEDPLKDKVGLDLTAAVEGAPFMEFTCGATSVSVRGSVILPLVTNKMITSAKLKFAAIKGKQKPDRFVEGPKDVLEASFNGGPFEQIGLNVRVTQTNEQAVETSSVV
jgi:hypothetical protein